MLPNLDIKLCDYKHRSGGIVLLTLGRSTRAIRNQSPFEAIIAINREGEISWHREFDFCLMDCRRSGQNTLLIMGTGGRAMEIGFDGKLLNQWYCKERFPKGQVGIALDTMKIHHGLCELTDGKIASISIKQHKLQEPAENWNYFMADTVVEFDRRGNITSEFSLADVLDINRFAHGSEAPYWEMQGWPKTKDWSHANCIIEDPKDGGLLVSLRHQDAIIKVTRDGELAWILGDPTGWEDKYKEKLLDIIGGRPFYHQHDLSFTSNGDLMLFDNGTAGAFPPKALQPIEERESFVLSYDINQINMTATETWRYGGADLPYSHYVSGVCEMPNGNKFIACTGICHDLDGKRVEVPPQGVGIIELIEVTPRGDRTFHATISDPDAGLDAGWSGFRPEYLSSDVELGELV